MIQNSVLFKKKRFFASEPDTHALYYVPESFYHEGSTKDRT